MKITTIGLFIALLSALVGTRANALVINFTNDSGNPAPVEAVAGFNAAADLWSDLLTDAVTLEMTISFDTLGPGILGGASSTFLATNLSDIKTLMLADSTTADDAVASASVASSPQQVLLNRTQENPNGAGSNDTYTSSANNFVNTGVVITQANALALGFGRVTSTDAVITFSDSFSFDYDRSDGISGGSFDFIGIAAHEIGHALGFVSIVDSLDADFGATPLSEADFAPTTLDLFRYSSLSSGAGVIDIAADSRSKYFSLDGGTTNLGLFSTGSNEGDGRQASHWKDNLGIGIMDPTFAPGELGVISSLDVRAFDVIGWDAAVAASSVPEIDGRSWPIAMTLLLSLLLLAQENSRLNRAPGAR